MKYLVFVDFDGVLTSTRMQFGQPEDSYKTWSTFDPVVMEFFNKVHNTFKDVFFVWTTTWRNGIVDSLHTEHWAYSMWYNAGFRGHFGTPWKVNPEELLPTNKRAEEVQHYLDNYGTECEDFVVLDDTDYGFNKVLLKKRFVRTSSEDGMLTKHMQHMWSLMGNWERK